MMKFKVSFKDFYAGFDPSNNLLYNVIRKIFGEVLLVDCVDQADIVIFSVFGNLANDSSSWHILNQKGILWLGENLRPNYNCCRYSISCDYETYGGRNFRLPLWMHEIDWFSTGLGVVTLSDVYNKLVKPSLVDKSRIFGKEFCVTVFNNPEGTRIEMYEKLSNLGKITSYGRPFGNWFPTTESYRDKLKFLEGHVFNLCPENSYYPGYYTEKCLHAKLAGCIPIYMADQYVYREFRRSSMLNLYDYLFVRDLVEDVQRAMSNIDRLAEIAATPLLYRMPTLTNLTKFLFEAILKCLTK